MRFGECERSGNRHQRRGKRIVRAFPQAPPAGNALFHEADIAKVQECLGHANVSTTRL